MSASLPIASKDTPLPSAPRDIAPLLLVPAIALLMLPLVGSFPTWVTLTIAGLAMGMMIFIMASGLTLVFGLMNVLNFGHGAFVSVGAFAATMVLLPMRGWLEMDSLLVNLGVLGLAVTVAMLVTALLGWAFERVIIMPVYGQHLKQIAADFGISESCLTNWMKAADVEEGVKPGTTAAENADLREARKRIRLLEQENEVLRRAAAYLSQANLPGK